MTTSVTKQYTTFRGIKVIIGDKLTDVEEHMWDYIQVGYKVKKLPQRTYWGLGNKFICRMETPKGQLENRMDGERW